MSTQTVDFSNAIPMDLSDIVEATTSNRPQLVSEPVKVPTQLKNVGQRRDYQMIDPRMIDIEQDFNPRKYDLPENRAHLDGLKISIAEVGLIHPLIVRFDPVSKRATVVDGESRLRAILELIAEGHPILSEADIPCFPAPKGSDDKATRLLTALTANTGKSLSQWEQGAAFQTLYNMGMSAEKIAAKVGVTVRFVNESMELADAPAEVKQMLSERAVTPSHALKLLATAPDTAVKTLQAQVQAKRDSGQKGPVKRAKATPAVAASSVSLPSAIRKALITLLADVPASDMEAIIVDGKELNETVYVNRAKLVKLAEALANDPYFKTHSI